MSRFAALLSSPFKHNSYTIRYGLAKGLRRQGGLGFLARSQPLSREEAFLSNLNLMGRVVYDVGGFEGIYTMFFARAVGPNGRVICFEPNPANGTRINTNLALNGFTNTELRLVGLGESARRESLVIPGGMAGRGTASQEIRQAYLDSSRCQTLEIEIDTMDAQAAVLPRPDFVKIDVEGMELDVLRGGRSTLEHDRPALFIELHGASAGGRLETAKNVLRFLDSLGYTCQHIESNQVVTHDRPPEAGRGHLYCFKGSPGVANR